MKTNELKYTDLRIGNWVKVHDPIFGVNNYKVATIRDNGIITISDNISCCVSNIEPIELTEEVLEKVGFDKYDEDMNIYAFESGRAVVVYVLNKKLLVIECVENNVLIDRNIRLNNVENLHQLQNAYYLLTNEELEVEL